MLHLSSTNFSAAREAHPQMLVQFFAPWCSHCAAIAPEFSAAADELAGRGVRVRLGKVDAIAEEALASAHGVESYPTLLWFDDDASPPRTYRGGRTRADIAAWVSRRVRSGAASEAIDNVEEARA